MKKRQRFEEYWIVQQAVRDAVQWIAEAQHSRELMNLAEAPAVTEDRPAAALASFETVTEPAEAPAVSVAEPSESSGPSEKESPAESAGSESAGGTQI